MSFLEKLEELTTNALKSVKIFDPSTLNDELAMKTEWNPMTNGGSNYKSNKLVEVSSTQLGFKPTIMAYLIPIIFIVMFAGGATIMAFTFVEQFGVIAYMAAAAFVIVPVVAGFFILRASIKPRIFDTREGIFYKGPKPSFRDYNQTTKHHCQLSKIYAIQLLKNHHTSSSSNGKTTIICYELNLVLNDTSRINVIVGSESFSVRNDAQKIAELLKVAVWDTI